MLDKPKISDIIFLKTMKKTVAAPKGIKKREGVVAGSTFLYRGQVNTTLESHAERKAQLSIAAYLA